MASTTTSDPASAHDARSTATRRLLVCGIVAGPLFVLLAAVQVLTRHGFDLSIHPISALSLGKLGWIQMANFIVTGLLAIAFSVGASRVFRSGHAAPLGPLLIGAYGVGLVGAGVFVADPAFGFPPGAPEGKPANFSWHAIAHGVATGLALLSLTAACFLFARRFGAMRRWWWVAYCIATGLATLALSPLAGEEGISVRLAAAALVTWAWVTAIGLWLSAESVRSSTFGSRERANSSPRGSTKA